MTRDMSRWTNPKIESASALHASVLRYLAVNPYLHTEEVGFIAYNFLACLDLGPGIFLLIEKLQKAGLWVDDEITGGYWITSYSDYPTILPGGGDLAEEAEVWLGEQPS